MKEEYIMKGIIIQYIVFLLMVFGILCAAIYVIFIKKRFFHTEEEYRLMNMPQEQLEMCLKLRKILEIPMRILTVIAAVFVLWVATPVLKDMKYIVSGKYQLITGEITNEIVKNGKAWRDTVIILSEEKKVKLSVNSLSYQKGDIVTVMYLPNTKAGVIVK